ncbi:MULTISPECIES: orotidine-5'-phosphate decarboxylase [Succinivibrio]|uniref:Orotidine 5'-phosphate decarboxylase n=1 Tax=Succinivibrio dextrinosolvens TaxID=83771 RepID=A0A662ZBE7_9GAMM|nr:MULTISPECIES: orotidine-5'-phosphate decarboxylase [Succinivibrio]MBQ9220803.1 orotidine-5'-phosphate decarboxylase [Succinivibrio sp.]MDY6420148.1 orotidine-5'-phosphate decarboxylase [Succinivibrio dextrinosolvens]SFK31536.1 orotidine-5'-phosphate decarboxylase [Succinivibrio dextrinosolvens]
MTESKVIVALDYNDEKKALEFVDRVSSNLCRLKVGNELFTSAGPKFVAKLVDKGFKVFLDLKYHDIPNTVSRACEAAADLGVWLVDVHTSGGPVMMSAAAEALSKYRERPYLIGVTVLTSMDSSQLNSIGVTAEPKEQVIRLAKLAKESGLDGVVSSAQEVTLIKTNVAAPFICVTPGIRPAGASIGDQKRIMTPAEAIAAGSDYLVIGRPITQAEDPVKALVDINASIQ